MAPTKRALLIASPFGGLRGPLNDVESMRAVLHEQDFDISQCCGDQATRKGILKAWQGLIEVCQADDVVVIYYSGHGGIIEDVDKQGNEAGDGAKPQQSSRYQFLVPVDFQSDLSSTVTDGDASFNGILDVELQGLLRATTDRTRNVTTIFDCCHSGRMARDPTHSGAVARNVPKVKYATVSQYVNRLRDARQVRPEAYLHIDGNKHAVRIAAAGSTETAWEHDENGSWVGVMTHELARALREAWANGDGSRLVPWRTMLMRVREMVNVKFSQQNPHVEGPDQRITFTLDESDANAFVLHSNGEEGILGAGRISGVRENNIYALLPLGFARVSETDKIGTATVTRAEALEAKARVELLPGKGSIPAEGVMAFLITEAMYKWPVAHPQGPEVLLRAIDDSRFVRRRDVGEDSGFVAEFRQDGRYLFLVDEQGRHILSQEVRAEDPDTWTAASTLLVSQAEQLARAKHLLCLSHEHESEKLDHGLAVTFGTMRHSNVDRIVETDGSGMVTEGEHIFISLRNNGNKKVFVSVFDINISGKITSVAGAGRGVEVPPAQAYHIGAGQLREHPQGQGLSLSWPSGISKAQAVNESLVFVVTDSPVDLRMLTNTGGADHRGDQRASTLERLTSRLAVGGQRDIASESGVFGSAFRAIKGIPACVWIINDHDEEILVVVSRYRPERMLTGVGLTLSATGVGVDLSSTSFTSPACKKSLTARVKGGDRSIGVFPLWTRSEGFGVVSIYKGPGMKLVVENDRIPLGATAFFTDRSDLRIVDYKGNEVVLTPQGRPQS